MFWLSQVNSAKAIPLLEQILKSASTEKMQDQAIFALSQKSDDRAQAVLRDYAKLRDKIFAGHDVPTFLVTSRGTKLEKPNLSRIFRELSRQVGIRKPGVRHGPRLHDFRHRFAVEVLTR